jgi:hypothetical protein
MGKELFLKIKYTRKYRIKAPFLFLVIIYMNIKKTKHMPMPDGPPFYDYDEA